MTSPLGGIALTTDLLANASKACPIPVLQTLLGLAALGLEVAAGLQGANQGAQLLARHVGEVALSVTSALDALHDSLPPEVEGSLSHLLSVVRAINDVLQRTSTLGRVQKILQRTTLAVEVKSLRQDLDAAMQTFRLSIILSTSRYLQREETRTKESSERVLKMLESVPPLTATWDLLPPAPHYLFGRDTELGLVTSCLCQRAEQGASLVLLGLGGVGKTSLVLAALHDVRLAQAYSSRRLFISCESAWDASGIVGALASALRLAGDSLRMRVLHALSEAPTLLVLDNLETPWEPKLSRTPVEQLLAAISNLPGMALIVTMRGAERPQGVQWTSPHIPVLQPFDRPAALQTVQHEAPNVSDDELASASLGELLDHLADHPLAVRIIGRLMNHESTDELLQRWKTEGTTLINEGGGDNKSSSLDISIRLSLDSSRMRSHPDTRSLLATLSLFPGGIPDSADGLVFLQPTLPRLLQHISVLKQASLVYINSAQRLSILPPIREYALRHLEPSNSSL
ncbi:P-loop containing nucleoside triphosphate hydrolase protein, partial [Auriculariales sp. MPI-PUGE-AT-0066]